VLSLPWNKTTHVVVIHTTTHTSTTLPTVLYVVGLLLQLAGGALIVRDIIDDTREAQRLRNESLPLRFDNIDETIEAIIGYLAGRKGRRWLGVALFVIGALVAFAANLIALS
jgi:hypothetical protein